MKYDSNLITEKQIEYLTVLIAEAELYSVDAYPLGEIEKLDSKEAYSIIRELINDIADRKYNLYIC